MIPPLRWDPQSRSIHLLDQTLLPSEERWLTIRDPETMAEAIRSLRIRGAPAIGIAAAYGVVLAVYHATTEDLHAAACEAITLLAGTRPTAVNLFWALKRMQSLLDTLPTASKNHLRTQLLAEAHAIHQEDLEAGRRIGEEGFTLLKDGMSLLTHCHAGGVATGGYGTALAPMFLAQSKQCRLHVYVDETRPLLQGSRITAWELQQVGIEATLITDSMAGHIMQRGKVDAVIVGADRVTANGDVANKIGTYTLAVLAQAHHIPFYVAMPLSTVDMNTSTGRDIIIEERAAHEITQRFGTVTAPSNINVYNPAFDVTPAHLVTAFITEGGILYPPFAPAFNTLLTEQ